ncbi:MAG TPA: MobF family relaxase [Nakamurella sp.]
MRGGLFAYKGSGKEARRYVESDHSVHSGAYYLQEGRGVAEHFTVSGATGEVLARAELNGEQYEAWVEGADPHSGELKGRLRNDDHAVRFVELIVNGPKTWSLAAAIHPDIATAYDAAQDRSVEAVARFLAREVTTRVGGRGKQMQQHVDEVTIAAIRHYTSRAGDPHRHIHFQVNARVLAGGKWRGLDSAAMWNMQRAIRGIGHRSVLADPRFRQALARHGYTLRADGELTQLADVVKPMSKRSKQVEMNLASYERDWLKRHPGDEPGLALRRLWDHRAWNDGRQRKAPTRPDVVPEHEWMEELKGLGVDIEMLRNAPATDVTGVLPGAIDRDGMAEQALRVVAAGNRGKSTWNTYDPRGVVEELLAEQHIYGDDLVLAELAEDVTLRVLRSSRTVLPERPVVPGHIRHFTSDAVVQLERDLNGRFATRGAFGHDDAPVQRVQRVMRRSGRMLDPAQIDAVRALAGTGHLVVVEGPAGAGKTSTLAALRDVLQEQGQRLIVVAPSRKAAIVASEEIDTEANTAAALAYAYGYRWDRHGLWKRLSKGDVDEKTGVEYRGPSSRHRLRSTDVLLVDEADMLNQENAQAILHVADETGVRLCLVGDRRQLSAVGRGGVMSFAHRWSSATVELDEVHRFRRADGSRDEEYAQLSLRMRSGRNPAAVFDELAAADRVKVHRTPNAAVEAIAQSATHRVLAGESESVSVSTNDMAAAVNEAVRDQLVRSGAVDEETTVHGSDGLRIGRGDRVMTRQNDYATGVANRQTWDVEAIHSTGGITLRDPRSHQAATVDADYVQSHVHLAYASTIHGVQGVTSEHGTVLLTAETDHAGTYVGMTRGKASNVVHVVANSLDEAKEQWVAASERDRADLGLDKATREAAAQAGRYASPPVERPYADLPDIQLAERTYLAGERVEALRAQLSGMGEPEGEPSTARDRLRERQRAGMEDELRSAAADQRDLTAEETLRAQRPDLSVVDVGDAVDLVAPGAGQAYDAVSMARDIARAEQTVARDEEVGFGR